MVKHMNIQFESTNASLDFTELEVVGWDSALQEYIDGTGFPARVIGVNKGVFTLSQGRGEWQATVSGKVRHKTASPDGAGLYPVIGDWVLVQDSVIAKVLPRKNALSRGAAGNRGRHTGIAAEEQVMAANVDTVCVVCGLDRDFNLRRIERYLTLVYNCGLVPVVVLTKADLHTDPAVCAEEVAHIAFGVPVHVVAADQDAGVRALEQYVGPGKTVTMVGSSGAGKSTLLNRLYGEAVQVTGPVSSRDGKGRHTTTGRHLICMPQGGMIIDNPGIREIAFHENGDGVDNVFADIELLAQECRFSDCTHTQERDCRVLEAVAEGKLSQDRLESYYKMKRELEYLSERRHKSADRVEKERWRDIALRGKAMKKNRKKR